MDRLNTLINSSVAVYDERERITDLSWTPLKDTVAQTSKELVSIVKIGTQNCGFCFAVDFLYPLHPENPSEPISSIVAQYFILTKPICIPVSSMS
ncbi:hypothetical protein WAI453_000533 [Rhynchosporium graminicola]